MGRYLLKVDLALLEDQEDGLGASDQLFQLGAEPRVFGAHAFSAGLLLVGEGGEDCGYFDGRHVVEVAREDEVGQQHFVVRIDLTGHSSLQRDHSSVDQPRTLDDSAVRAHLVPQDQTRFLLYLAAQIPYFFVLLLPLAVFLETRLESFQILDLLLSLDDPGLQSDCFRLIGVDGQHGDFLAGYALHGLDYEGLGGLGVQVVGHVGDLQRGHLEDAAQGESEHHQFSLVFVVANGSGRGELVPGADVDEAVHEVDWLWGSLPTRLAGVFLLVEVDADSEAPIDGSIDQVHDAADVEEGEDALRLVGQFPQFLLVLHQSLLEEVQSLKIFFLGECSPKGLLFLGQLRLECWELGILLELEKRPREDVLQVDVLQPLAVEQHVIVDVEAAVEAIRVALQHGLGHLLLHLLVEHQDRRALLVQPTPASPTTHLDVLPSSQPSRLLPVELLDVGEDHCAGGHVEAHRESFGREEDLQQSLLEEQLHYFLHEGQQSSVVDAYSLLHDLLHGLDGRQLPILLIEHQQGPPVDELDPLLLRLGGQIVLGADGFGVRLHILLAEAEDDHWIQLSFHDGLDDLGEVRALTQVPLLLVQTDQRALLAQGLDGLVEVILVELALVVDGQVESLSARGTEVVLEGHWAVVGVDHVAGLFAQLGDPHCELSRVADGGREEDVLDVGGQHDDGLLPDHSPLLVPHVVHLVEDHPLHLPHYLASPVDHVPQDLSGHHQAGGALVDAHVSSHQAHVHELLLQLSVLLVREGLDGRRVDHPAVPLEGQRDGVLGDGGLAC